MRPATLRRLIASYRESGMSHLGPGTAANYGKHLKALERLWGDRHAHRIEQREILAKLERKGYDHGYVSLRHRIRILGHVYKHGIASGLVSVNPCAGVKMGND